MGNPCNSSLPSQRGSTTVLFRATRANKLLLALLSSSWSSCTEFECSSTELQVELHCTQYKLFTSQLAVIRAVAPKLNFFLINNFKYCVRVQSTASQLGCSTLISRVLAAILDPSYRSNSSSSHSTTGGPCGSFQE